MEQNASLSVTDAGRVTMVVNETISEEISSKSIDPPNVKLTSVDSIQTSPHVSTTIIATAIDEISAEVKSTCITKSSIESTSSTFSASPTVTWHRQRNITGQDISSNTENISTSGIELRSTYNASSLDLLTTQSETYGGSPQGVTRSDVTSQSDVTFGVTQSGVTTGSGQLKLVIIGAAGLALLFIVLMLVVVICVFKKRRRKKLERMPDGEFGLNFKVLKVRSSFTFAQQSFSDLRSPNLAPPSSSTEQAPDQKSLTSRNFDNLLTRYHLEPEIFSGPESPPVYLMDIHSSIEDLRGKRSHGSASDLFGNTSDDVKYSTFKRSAKPSDMSAHSTEITV